VALLYETEKSAAYFVIYLQARSHAGFQDGGQQDGREVAGGLGKIFLLQWGDIHLCPPLATFCMKPNAFLNTKTDYLMCKKLKQM
jgi:hypothetical protein